MAGPADWKPHIFIDKQADTSQYGSVASRAKTDLPQRDRAQHGAYLQNSIRQLIPLEQLVAAEQAARGLASGRGMTIQFEGEPNFELKLDSLDLKKDGIELLSVVVRENRTLAAVFVPEGRLKVFLQKVEDYAERDTRFGKPRNQAFVASIANIRRATLEALWTDDRTPFPATDDPVWWEVWLRKGSGDSTFEFLKENAGALGLRVGDQTLEFVERRVVMAWGTPSALSKSLTLLAGIAELRAAHDTADMYDSLSPLDQADWIEAATDNMVLPSDDATAVCILDTGLNPAHPLLLPLTSTITIQTYDATWNSDDHDGHGTAMAGIAAYGDLTHVLQGSGATLPRCVLESCKILPPLGHNDPKLYGAITWGAVSLAEIAAPRRRRVLQSAVTADGGTSGKPSSWSAAIDSITSGATDDIRRLFVLSVGNARWKMSCAYPDEAHTSACEDPSQSWNALAVGGYTEKVWIDAAKWPTEIAIAPPGALCPESRTSLIWSNRWPVRPDIVMEAGNLSSDPATGLARDLDELALLTTGHQHLIRPLTLTRGTSPAGADAAGLAAETMTAYPNLWPESVRGLLVHSSDWTQAMLQATAGFGGKQQYRALLRTCGWGVPNRELALHSLSNSLTLIAQDTLRPYRKGRSGISFRDMHLHRLPWPIEALRNMFDTEVELRVTLSYFIEPSPGERGYSGPFTYASHGLRFALQASNESVEQFQNRVNVAARDEDDDGNYGGDAAGWLLGPMNRNKGSLHSDRWVGTAVELAGRANIAVFPIGGWWRYRPHLERFDKPSRYALLLSIRTPSVGTDLYTEIQQQITIQQQVAVEVPIEV